MFCSVFASSLFVMQLAGKSNNLKHSYVTFLRGKNELLVVAAGDHGVTEYVVTDKVIKQPPGKKLPQTFSFFFLFFFSEFARAGGIC